MNRIDYDPGFIRDHATMLYEEAGMITRNWMLMGTLSGYVIGTFAAGPTSLMTLAVATVLTGLGFVMGHDRARQMRLEAQLALLQLRVEAHAQAQLSEMRQTFRQIADAVAPGATFPAPSSDEAEDEAVDEAPAPTEAPVSATPPVEALPAIRPAAQHGSNAPRPIDEDEEASMQALAAQEFQADDPSMFLASGAYEVPSEVRPAASGSPEHSGVSAEASRTFVDDDEEDPVATL